MNSELKGMWNTELDAPISAAFEQQKICAEHEAERADRMTRWLVLTLCALCLSAAFHWQQANNLRDASQTILSLGQTVFDLQEKTSADVANFRKPLKGHVP